MNPKRQLKEIGDTINSTLSMLFKLSMIIGVITFCVYCLKINYFPSNYSFSGFSVLILISVVLGFILVMFLGLLWVVSELLIGIGVYIQRFIKKYHHDNYHLFRGKLNAINTNCPKRQFRISFSHAMRAFSMSKSKWAFCIFYAILIGIATYKMNLASPLVFLEVVFVAIVINLLYKTFRFEYGVKNLERLTLDNNPSLSNAKNSLSKDGYGMLAIVFIMSLVLLLPQVNLTANVMHILGISQHDVQLHIKKPYHHFLDICEIEHESSIFGDDYHMINHADILMRNIDGQIIFKAYKQNPQDDNCDVATIDVPKTHVFMVKFDS